MIGGDGWRDQIMMLAGAVGAGLVVMFIAAAALRMPERWWALGKVGNTSGLSSVEPVR